MRKIGFSMHALQRMEEREISGKQVLDVLLHPDEKEDSFKERRVAIRTINTRKIHVIYKEELEQVIVITVY